jgi:hypothetical protein
MRGKPKLIHELVSEIPFEKSIALMKGLLKDQNKRHDNCSLFASEVTGIKQGIGQRFQGNGEVSISGQIEPLQMKPPTKTDFSAIIDEAPSIPELPSTRVIRKGVIPLSSQMPAKEEDDDYDYERYIQNRKKNIVSLWDDDDDDDVKRYIQNIKKSRVSLWDVFFWGGGVLILITCLIIIAAKKLTGFPEDYGVSLLVVVVVFWVILIEVTLLIMAAISLIRSLIKFYEKL